MSIRCKFLNQTRKSTKKVDVCCRFILRGVLFAALSILLASTVSCAGMGSASRILFLGNSYSFGSNFRITFAELAKAVGHNVVTDWAVGRTLADHVASTTTMDLLTSSEWDFVILQEQTQIPSIEQFRTELMYPAARELVQKISVSGASPMFFQTSAGRHGWPENGLNGYESIQLQINQGYLKIAQELNVPMLRLDRRG